MDKGENADELVIANNEIALLNRENENRADLKVAYQELALANAELLFQNQEKEKHAAELSIANKALLFEIQEKEKRASELLIAYSEIQKAEADVRQLNAELEQKVIKRSAQYAFISQVNQAIVYVKDAETLFRHSCRIALEFGNYKMAWIGGFDTTLQKITLIDSGGIADQDISLFTDVPFEPGGPHDHVLRTGKYFLSNNIAQTLETEEWKPFDNKHTSGSFITLPIRKAGSIFGTFNLYATEINYFDTDDIALLIEVTGDISFALDMFEKEKRHKEAELELQKNFVELEAISEEQSAILNTLPASIALLDNKGNIVKVNDEWIQFGISNGLDVNYPHLSTNYIEVSEKSLGRDEKEGKKMAHGLQQILSGATDYFTMEYPCDSPTEKRWFKAEVKPFKSQQLTGAVVMHINISERKKAEAEMLLLINNTDEAFILLDNKSKIISFNNQFCKLYNEYIGLEVQKGDSYLDYVRPHRKETVAAIYRKVLQGNAEESEATFPGLGGSRYFSIKYNPAKDDLGNIFGVFITVVNVTEKKNAEEQKEFARRNKEALINSTDDLIWSISRDFKLIAANNSFINELKKHTGVEIKKGDDLLKSDSYSAENIRYWKELYSRAHNGESFKIEIYTPNFGERDESWTETNFSPITVNDSIAGIACHSRDITERKKSELERRANETRLAEAQSLAKLGNWETDLLNSTVIWSAQAYRIFEGNPDDFDSSHSSFLSFVHPDDRDKVVDAFNNSLTGNSINSLEHRIITKTGEVKFLEENWQIFHDNNNIPIKAVGTCQDITDRKKSEHENKFKAELLDTIAQAVIATDMNGRITFWNRAAVEIYGWTLEEVIGQSIVEITPSLQTQADAERLMEKLAKGESWSGEFYVKRKDGSLFPAYVYNSPLFDEFGKQTGIIGISNDISERKEYELERTKITNDLLQRNRDLEQFTFIISHNLRAPTANIIGFTDILQDETLTLQEQKELLHGLSSSVSGLDTVIRDINSILQVKREISEKKEMIRFSKLVGDVMISIENIIDNQNVLVTTDFSEIAEIFSFKAYMHSIFYNLISNSIKYRKPDQQPLIEIKSRKEDGKLILSFKDNGLGIDLKKKGDKVFGLYKRFHSHVEGKGLGLFLVKTQVEAIGGKISITSELNKGTEFTIVFDN